MMTPECSSIIYYYYYYYYYYYCCYCYCCRDVDVLAARNMVLNHFF
jgi:hypothetical protein